MGPPKVTSKQNSFKIAALASEFYYNNGRTDVIALSKKGNLIAFEAKLTRWKKAMHQAYRNSSFAHYSYVLVPSATAKNALRKTHEFKRLGVGLCSIDPSGIKIEISASKKKPIQPWLTNKASSYIKNK